MTDEPEAPTEGRDTRLLREAKKRFKRCSDFYAVQRARMLDDIKFCNADAYNMYQWPQQIQSARGYGTNGENEKPCLTVNKTRQHCLQIVNDGRQNKTSIKVRPTGNGATYEAAQVYEGIFRHIEYISNAQAAYTRASTCQVQGGVGFVRLNTRYVDDESFDQDIYIETIFDPLSVFRDPDYQEPDGSDMRYGFVFADVARDQFEAQYPNYELPTEGVGATLGFDEGAWISKDKVRVADYYHRTEVKDTLIVFTDPNTGQKTPVKRSDLKGMSGELLAAFDEQLADPQTKRRTIIGHEVERVKIAGDKIVRRDKWAGQTIPIYFAEGERTLIEGELDIKGHTRALLDPQRMYNYNASAAIEYGALQGQTPYLAPAAAIEELGTYWERENLDNLAVLPWNHKDDEGGEIPKPERVKPPMAAPVYQQGMENAAQDMMLVSGQYQPMMGEPSNERSGKAIQARQRQGENATYHFIDNLAMMIRRLGKDIIALAPKIYDTPRVMQIMGEDGVPSDIKIDPEAAQAYEKRKAQTADAAEQVIFNPTVGQYDVISDVGPDYATRRQEAFNALSQIAAQNPELMSIIGDLVMLAADFPLADEAAERLKRMCPPQALGDGPNPQVTALEQKLSAMQTLLGTLSEKLRDKASRDDAQQQQKAVDIYKAITDRLETIMKYTNVPETEILRFQHDLAKQEHAGNIAAAQAANAAELAADSGEGDTE